MDNNNPFRFTPASELLISKAQCMAADVIRAALSCISYTNTMARIVHEGKSLSVNGNVLSSDLATPMAESWGVLSAQLETLGYKCSRIHRDAAYDGVIPASVVYVIDAAPKRTEPKKRTRNVVTSFGAFVVEGDDGALLNRVRWADGSTMGYVERNEDDSVTPSLPHKDGKVVLVKLPPRPTLELAVTALVAAQEEEFLSP